MFLRSRAETTSSFGTPSSSGLHQTLSFAQTVLADSVNESESTKLTKRAFEGFFNKNKTTKQGKRVKEGCISESVIDSISTVTDSTPIPGVVGHRYDEFGLIKPPWVHQRDHFSWTPEARSSGWLVRASFGPTARKA
jgi:hypothetical protein